MKSILIIAITFCTLSACSGSRSPEDVTYIKVLKEQPADTITTLNSGIALDEYLYYSFVNDSVVYRSVSYDFPRNSRTLVGQFRNTSYVDTLLLLAKVLANEQNGLLLVDSTMFVDPDPATFHIEYKDRFGIHRRSFVAIGNDTLHRFAWFLNRLPDMPWPKREGSESLFNSEAEIIEAAKANGTFSRLP